jgi:RNA polymerase sigma-70 factor (ECF subfamily)
MEKSVIVKQDEAYLDELWFRFKNGDEQALNELARMRYRLLFNYATRFTKDTELIKDCIQDLFLELWYRRTGLVNNPYVTVYLVKSLRNNLLRKIKINSRVADSADFSEACERLTDNLTVETIMISDEAMSEKEAGIRLAISKLPKRQQEVVFLKFYEGMSNDEIAEVMEVERQSVSNFLYRAIGQLKNDLILVSRSVPNLLWLLFLPE